MNCEKCPAPAVIELQHGPQCRNHFISYFEERVFKTISKFRLISHDDRLGVAVSGGKDSLTVLYLTKKYLQKQGIEASIQALAIDEGIAGYRDHTLRDLKVFCKNHHIPCTIISFQQELGKTLDEAYP